MSYFFLKASANTFAVYFLFSCLPIWAKEVCRENLTLGSEAISSPRHYTITRNDFLVQAHEAQEQFPDTFAAVSVAQEVFRIDSRPPIEIKRAGGFWPSPDKPAGTLIEHTIGFQGREDSLALYGTGSYVSTSQDPPDLGKLAVTIRQLWQDVPPLLKVNGEIVKMSKYDWNELANGMWPEVLARFEKPSDKKDLRAVWSWNNYRATNVEGIRVVGGKFVAENEFIVRGIPENQIESYQEVRLECKLWFEERSVQGEILKLPKVPLHSSWRTSVYGDWLPF